MLPKIEWGDAMMRKPGFLYSRARGPTKMTLFQQVNYDKVYQMYACVLSHAQLFATPWTVACKAPLSMEFSRQEYCSGLPFPSPGDLFDPGITPMTHLFPALAGRFFTTVPLGNPTVLSKFLKQNLNTLCTFKFQLTGFSTYTGPDSHYPSHQVHSLAR